MNRGLYNSASAILTLNRNMNSKAHNLANIHTTGYKYDNVHNDVFEKVILSYRGNEIGEMPTRVGIDKITTVLSQGSLITTDRPLDIAITGDGYIKVDRGNGEYSYTRNGSMNIDAEGYIVDYNGNYIMGQKGRINLSSATNISIKSDGSIISNGEIIDKLYITGLNNPVKQSHSYFKADREIPGQFTVAQGYQEASNVDTAKELTDVIGIQRLLTSNTKMLQTQDELNKKIIDGIR